MSSEHVGFPTLKHALITKVHIADAHDLGTLHNGSRMVHYGAPTGTIETMPGFEPAFKAMVDFGADWVSFDPDGKFGRIDLRAMLVEMALCVDYEGVVYFMLLNTVKTSKFVTSS